MVQGPESPVLGVYSRVSGAPLPKTNPGGRVGISERRQVDGNKWILRAVEWVTGVRFESCCLTTTSASSSPSPTFRFGPGGSSCK